MTASQTLTRVRTALVLLAVASGATDAFAFLMLGGIFTANMTGNLVLLGLFSRPTWLPTVAGAVSAIVFFAGAAYLGFRVTRPHPEPPNDGRRPVRAIAFVGLALQLIVAIVWPLLHGAPSLVVQCCVISVSAAALGLQTVLAKRISGPAGLTTTFVTGTLTTLMQELAEHTAGSRALQLFIVIGLAVGSVAGATMVVLASPWAPALAFVLVAVAVGLLSSTRVLH